jgi:hypothetical protein
MEKHIETVLWQAVDAGGCGAAPTAWVEFTEGICISPVFKRGSDTDP